MFTPDYYYYSCLSTHVQRFHRTNLKTDFCLKYTLKAYGAYTNVGFFFSTKCTTPTNCIEEPTDKILLTLFCVAGSEFFQIRIQKIFKIGIEPDNADPQQSPEQREVY